MEMGEDEYEGEGEDEDDSNVPAEPISVVPFFQFFSRSVQNCVRCPGVALHGMGSHGVRGRS